MPRVENRRWRPIEIAGLGGGGREDYLEDDSAGKRKRQESGGSPDWRGRRKSILSRGDAGDEVVRRLEKGKMEKSGQWWRVE